MREGGGQGERAESGGRGESGRWGKVGEGGGESERILCHISNDAGMEMQDLFLAKVQGGGLPKS